MFTPILMWTALFYPMSFQDLNTEYSAHIILIIDKYNLPKFLIEFSLKQKYDFDSELSIQNPM